ncbi:MAG TPA: C4-dicarboxylate transporter DctA [Caulobacteraceae bacterium]|nr:C4-dicarboxylate transporter DctA [Caulobacteraceae bacterium]
MRLLKSLYVQVLIGIVLGVLVGVLWPSVGQALKPLGDGFVRLVRMLVAPIIFCTVAGAIGRASDLGGLGRIGGKAIVYFEAVSTLALAIGLVVAAVFRPGAGFNVDPRTLDPHAVAAYADQARHIGGAAEYLLGLIPNTFLGALSGGDILQTLLVAILAGLAIGRLGAANAVALKAVGVVGEAFFVMIRLVVSLAPVGAFGAMAFTVGQYGLAALAKLGVLVGAVYLTSALFVVIVLGAIGWLAGFSVLRLIAYLKEELLIVFGASASEAVLPQLMVKLERLGAPAKVVGLVVPAGYSFNLDGTNIYMTLASLFLAQATNTHVTLGQELALMVVAMLTSKGAAGVTGGGFITLAATLAVVPTIPVAAMALVIGVDRFLSQCRALTNFMGNAVAALVIARWEGAIDPATLRAGLRAGPDAALPAPAEAAG